MKKLALIFIAMLGIAHMIYSQVPDSFNYQSVVRNSEGEPVINTNINFQLSILEGSSEGTTVFTETQLIKSNSYGICTIKVGAGADASGSLADLDWGNNNYYLNIAVDITGSTSFTDIGTVELLSVPYALYAKDVEAIDKEILYFPETDTLFAVKDRDGKIVFAVFPDGARVYVNEGVKGPVGGFAVTGRNPGKAVIEEDYILVTPDSTRVWVNEEVKGKVGGFAVTGRNPAKGMSGDYFVVTSDSARIYINDTTTTKGKVGGFAITGRNPRKGPNDDYLRVTRDSTRVYVTESETKGPVGGFAVTGRNPGKTSGVKFMDITRDNYFIGHESGQKNVDGLYNSFFGYQSGLSNRGDAGGYAGSYNVFLGYKSGYMNTNGYSNIFIGYEAGYNNTNTPSNIFIGYQAGRNATGGVNSFIGGLTGINCSGTGNVFIGNQSGRYTGTGYQNTFLGTNSGYSNQTGIKNVFLGFEAGSGNISGESNVFIGYRAGASESGSDKLYIENSSSSTPLIYGDFANDLLRFNAEVLELSSNSGIDLLIDADIDNATETDNPRIILRQDGQTIYGSIGLIGVDGDIFTNSRANGMYVMHNVAASLQLGTNNTPHLTISSGGGVGIGTTIPAYKLDVNGEIVSRATNAFRLRNSSFGAILRNDNSALYLLLTDSGDPDGGWNSLRPITVGLSTGDVTIASTLLATSSGYVGIGTYSPARKLHVYENNNTGDFAAYIHHDGGNVENHGLRIAAGANSSNTGTTYMISFANGANSGIGSIKLISSAIQYATTSDRRLKTNITATRYKGLDAVMNLPVVDFEFKSSPGYVHTGFIAQDLEKVFPYAVSANDEGFLSIDKSSFVPILTKAVQEQQEIIDSQKEKITDLEQRIAKLEQLLMDR